MSEREREREREREKGGGVIISTKKLILKNTHSNTLEIACINLIRSKIFLFYY